VHDTANNAERKSKTSQASRCLSAIAELLVNIARVDKFFFKKKRWQVIPIFIALYRIQRYGNISELILMM